MIILAATAAVLVASAAVFYRVVWISWSEGVVLGAWIEPDQHAAIFVFPGEGCSSYGELELSERGSSDIRVSIRFRHEIGESCTLQLSERSVHVTFTSAITGARFINSNGQPIRLSQEKPRAKRFEVSVGRPCPESRTLCWSD